MSLLTDAQHLWKVIQAFLRESAGRPVAQVALRQVRFVHLFACTELEACREPNADSWYAVRINSEIAVCTSDDPPAIVIKLLGLEIASSHELYGHEFKIYPLIENVARDGMRYRSWFGGDASIDWGSLFVYDYQSRCFRCLHTLYPLSARKAIYLGMQDEVRLWVEAMFEYAKERAGFTAGDPGLDVIGIRTASTPAQLQPYRACLEQPQVPQHDHRTERILHDLAPAALPLIQAPSQAQVPAAAPVAAPVAEAVSAEYRVPPPPSVVEFGANVAVGVHHRPEHFPRIPERNWAEALAGAEQARFELYGAFDLESVRKVSPPQGGSWDDVSRMRAADALAHHLFSKGILDSARDQIHWVQLDRARNSFVVQLVVDTCKIEDAQRIHAVGRQMHRASPYTWRWFAYRQQARVPQVEYSATMEDVEEHKQGSFVAASAAPIPVSSASAAPVSIAATPMPVVIPAVPEERPVMDLPAHYMSVNVRGGKAADLNTARTSGAQVNTAQTAPYRVLVRGIVSYKARGDTSVSLTENAAERQTDASFILVFVRTLIPPEHLDSLLFLLRHTDMSVELGFARTCAASAVKATASLVVVPCMRFFA
jgi:hypothetical protein